MINKKSKNIEFFDTETVNNKTVLICNSKNYRWNSKGLSVSDCFDFLISNAEKYNYFFRIDYDVNMIIKNMPKKNIVELFETNETTYKKYRLQYYRNKIFVINKKRFYDIANFFGVSLLKTIEILDIDLTDEEKTFIEKMKKLRGIFTFKDKNKIINYSLLENKIGLKIVKKILSLIPSELQTYALYGSSSLTNIFLRKGGVKGNLLFSNELFEKSFFGGRMECLKIGTFNNVYKYDINSAYPNVIKDLREPVFYKIKNYTSEHKIVDTNLYEVTFNHKTKNEIGSLPVRLKSGYLVFPKQGGGIYYGCELKQAIKRGVEIKINKYVDVVLGKKIFNGEIENYYKIRNELKQKKDKKNLIYKLLLNSIYGKFAQRVGSARFRNTYLAGYITAQVRSQLLNAVYNNDNAIIFFATDGILTKKKLPVKIGGALGEFEEIKIKQAKVLLAGVYKLIDEDKNISIGERGFRFDFDKAFDKISRGGIYSAKLLTFISNIYAFKNYKVFSNSRCKFVEITKKIDVTQQHKRIFKTFDVKKENHSLLLNEHYLKKIDKLPKLDDFDLLSEFEFDIY